VSGWHVHNINKQWMQTALYLPSFLSSLLHSSLPPPQFFQWTDVQTVLTPVLILMPSVKTCRKELGVCASQDMSWLMMRHATVSPMIFKSKPKRGGGNLLRARRRT